MAWAHAEEPDSHGEPRCLPDSMPNSPVFQLYCSPRRAVLKVGQTVPVLWHFLVLVRLPLATTMAALACWAPVPGRALARGASGAEAEYGANLPPLQSLHGNHIWVLSASV